MYLIWYSCYNLFSSVNIIGDIHCSVINNATLNLKSLIIRGENEFRLSDPNPVEIQIRLNNISWTLNNIWKVKTDVLVHLKMDRLRSGKFQIGYLDPKQLWYIMIYARLRVHVGPSKSYPVIKIKIILKIINFYFKIICEWYSWNICK